MTSVRFALLHYLHHVLSGLIWVQTVCKGYQQKSQLAGKELNSALSDGVKKNLNGCTMPKHVYRHLRLAKAQISPLICAV